MSLDCEHELQGNLIEGSDYDHLPQLAWNKLVARFGLTKSSEPIVRYEWGIQSKTLNRVAHSNF